MYSLIVLAIGGILYGIPALKDVAKVHKTKLAFAAGAGLILLIFIYLGEQLP